MSDNPFRMMDRPIPISDSGRRRCRTIFPEYRTNPAGCMLPLGKIPCRKIRSQGQKGYGIFQPAAMGIVFPPGRLFLSRNGQNENGSEEKVFRRKRPYFAKRTGKTGRAADCRHNRSAGRIRTANCRRSMAFRAGGGFCRTDGVNEILMQKDRKAFR